MGSLFEWITDWIKEGLIDAITGQYTSIFNSVNNQVADVANQVGQTPQGWNGGVFSMIQNLSETVVIPIAGMILTFVLVYELIQMILEKNNMHEFDTFNIFKWIFKTFVATYLLTNCFTIVMAVFDVAQNVVSQSAGVINGNLDVQAALSDLETQLEAMGMWELIGLWLETNIINLCMWVLSIVIFLPKEQPHRAAQTDPVRNTVTGHISMGTNISSVFRKRHRRRNRQHRRKRVWIANRRKHPSWNLLRMNCRRRQRIKSSPMQDGRRNGLHKKQSRRKIVCRPGKNCAWRRFPTWRPEKPKNT